MLLPLPLGSLPPPHLVGRALESELDVAPFKGAKVVVRGCDFLDDVSARLQKISGRMLTSNHSGLMAVTVRR